MADYLFLFRGGAARREASPEDMQANMRRWGAWFEELTKKGHYHGSGAPLENTGRVVSDNKSGVTDGPFVESKDLVGGYALITANSIDDAATIARDCPIFEYDGFVEVRPIREMNL